MSVKIQSVNPGSPADRANIRPGETLLSINGQAVSDVLDYRFYMTDPRLTLRLLDEKKAPRTVRIRKGEYQELGLEFETYLMDRKRSCKNKCVFCFVDQTPPGMRETLYFKDDDERLSFLFGSYITLTNLKEPEISRILKMHISPVNVSVHCTRPELRVKLMGNPHAGEVMERLRRLAEGGIALNTQLVLCPGLNDGEELERSLRDLLTLVPALQSVAGVPVGLTRFRDGLYPLETYNQQTARETLQILEEYGERSLRENGSRIIYPADEFYLLAQRPIPETEFYEDFPQLENGVGMLALLEEEFTGALRDSTVPPRDREVSIATGEAAFPLIRKLADQAEQQFSGLKVRVYRILNHFFGRTVTVAGLITGKDLMEQLSGQPLGKELLLPGAMLRHEQDRFLDDVSLPDLESKLTISVRIIEKDGRALLNAMLGTG